MTIKTFFLYFYIPNHNLWANKAGRHGWNVLFWRSIGRFALELEQEISKRKWKWKFDFLIIILLYYYIIIYLLRFLLRSLIWAIPVDPIYREQLNPPQRMNSIRHQIQVKSTSTTKNDQEGRAFWVVTDLNQHLLLWCSN